jgi:hypothetical protein
MAVEIKTIVFAKSRTENPQTAPYKCRQLIFEKGAKDNLVNKWHLANWKSIAVPHLPQGKNNPNKHQTKLN